MVVRVKCSETIVNQQNGSTSSGVPRDWSRGIHSINKVPRPNSPHSTYCHQSKHQINEYPFIEDNVRQGFAKHFQNLNLELAKVGNHGPIELEDLDHERVRIPNKLIKQIRIDNRVKMRAQTRVDVVSIYVTPIQSLLQQNNIGITYVETLNFRMQLRRFVPLYYVVMPQFIITIIEAPFVSTPVTIVGSMKPKPHTPRGTKFVNLHEDFPREMNKVFSNEPSY